MRLLEIRHHTEKQDLSNATQSNTVEYASPLSSKKEDRSQQSPNGAPSNSTKLPLITQNHK